MKGKIALSAITLTALSLFRAGRGEYICPSDFNELYPASGCGGKKGKGGSYVVRVGKAGTFKTTLYGLGITLNTSLVESTYISFNTYTFTSDNMFQDPKFYATFNLSFTSGKETYTQLSINTQ